MARHETAKLQWAVDITASGVVGITVGKRTVGMAFAAGQQLVNGNRISVQARATAGIDQFLERHQRIDTRLLLHQIRSFGKKAQPPRKCRVYKSASAHRAAGPPRPPSRRARVPAAHPMTAATACHAAARHPAGPPIPGWRRLSPMPIDAPPTDSSGATCPRCCALGRQENRPANTHRAGPADHGLAPRRWTDGPTPAGRIAAPAHRWADPQKPAMTGLPSATAHGGSVPRSAAPLPPWEPAHGNAPRSHL